MSLSILSCALVSVPDPGMWELSVFSCFGLCLFVSLPFTLGCALMVAPFFVVCLCPGCGLCFVVCGVAVNQVFLVVG